MNQLAKKKRREKDEEEKLDSELTCQNSNLVMMEIIIYICVGYDVEPFSNGSLSRKC